MAHLAKYAAGAAGGVLKHDERTEKDKVQSRKNESIDSSRTHLNYNLAPKRKYNSVEKTVEEYTSREEIHLLKRKNVNVMCSWVVTMPTQLRREEQDKFFRELYKFLENRYGHKSKDGVCRNILTASVHLDETTPHMHFGYIPVAYDGKNNRYTVSAKLVNDRFDLQEFHKDLSAHMTRVFGRNIGIENGATKNGNQTIEQLKEKSKLEKEIQELEYQKTGAEKAVEAAQSHYLDLEGRNKLEEKKLKEREMSQKEIESLDLTPKKLVGGFKGLSPEQAQKLQITALSAKKQAENFEKENNRLRTQVKERDDAIHRLVSSDAKNQNKINLLSEKLSFYQKALKPETVQKLEIAFQNQQHRQKKKGLSR